MLAESIFHGHEDFMGFINYTEELQKRTKGNFNNYCFVFSFTTENLDSYLRELNVDSKNVLTVTSSGDQLINLALLGAKEIDCFDINRLCYYYAKLKLTMLMYLTYEDFIEYFTYCEDSMLISGVSYPVNIKDSCYDYKIYNKIRDKLEFDVQLFFDEVYAAYEYSGRDISKSKFFSNISIQSAKSNNTYLMNRDNYDRAKEKVRELYQNNKIKFYNLDVFELHKLENVYDIVLLSNIYDYIPVDNQDAFVQYIQEDMDCILKDDSQVVVEYQYCGSQRVNNDGFIKNLAINVSSITDGSYTLSNDIQALGKFNLSLIKVPTIYKSYRKINMEDCVYVYKK